MESRLPWGLAETRRGALVRRLHLASLVGICLACGNSFQSGGGSAGAGGQGLQNSAGNGDTSSGGTLGTAGTSGKGGRSGTGGATGSAGALNTGGSGGTVGSAGTAGSGGINIAGVGGTNTGGGGTAGNGPDCSVLLQDYTDLLAKARECNPNALVKECALDSTLPMPPSLCCPTPVNTSSQFTLQARQALNDYRASCVPPPCLQVLCTAPGTVDCFQVTSGPGDFRCSSTNAMTQN